MKPIIKSVRGVIDRRLLINFRIRPDMVSKLLPAQFRPKLIDGWAVGGICLIRLKGIRLPGLPAACGLSSENAAHRFAVEWCEHGKTREGVFIARRDTSSRFQMFAGRLFPGVHHLAEFEVNEAEGEFNVKLRSRDGHVSVDLRARQTSAVPVTSVFRSLAEASAFFERGSCGYSAGRNPDHCDGLELHAATWSVEPLEVQFVHSSFFDDPSLFPCDTIRFDSALLMRNIEHEWRVLPRQRKNS
jgi:hypothetical protein